MKSNGKHHVYNSMCQLVGSHFRRSWKNIFMEQNRAYGNFFRSIYPVIAVTLDIIYYTAQLIFTFLPQLLALVLTFNVTGV